MPRLIVLRPEPGNGVTCARIAALGGEALAMPLFEVRPIDWTPPDPAGFDALLLTSANAPRHAGPELTGYAHLPVVAVGRATARAAAAAGLTVAATGESDGQAAVGLLATIGATRALALTGRDHVLRAGGRLATALPVYASDAVAVSRAALDALRDVTVLLHSPRAGARLSQLVAAPGRARITVAAISANALAAAGTGWRWTTIAPTPDDDALIAAALSIDPAGCEGNKTA